MRTFSLPTRKSSRVVDSVRTGSTDGLGPTAPPIYDGLFSTCLGLTSAAVVRYLAGGEGRGSTRDTYGRAVETYSNIGLPTEPIARTTSQIAP